MKLQDFSIEPLESRLELKRWGYHCHYGRYHFHWAGWFRLYFHRHISCHWGWY